MRQLFFGMSLIPCAAMTKPVRDIELAYQWPAHISRKSRAWVARLGALFLVAQVAAVLLLVLL